jgi:hypothetical protein
MDPDNLARMARALRQLDARISAELVPDSLAFDCAAEALARA